MPVFILQTLLLLAIAFILGCIIGCLLRSLFAKDETPIEVLLFSDDMNALAAYSATLEPELAAIPGMVDLRSSLEEGNPELQISFDRTRLAMLGLDMQTVAETLRDRARITLNFGQATWPHQLVRIMLLEQLYRAVTVLSGHPYHRE